MGGKPSNPRDENGDEIATPLPKPTISSDQARVAYVCPYCQVVHNGPNVSLNERGCSTCEALATEQAIADAYYTIIEEVKRLGELLAKIQAELFLAENKKGMLEKDLANLVSERAPQLSTEYLIKVSST